MLFTHELSNYCTFLNTCHLNLNPLLNLYYKLIFSFLIFAAQHIIFLIHFIFYMQVGNMTHISTLSLDLLKNIAFRLLPDHIKNYFHFRAVCRNWRSCTPGPQDLAFCFRPLNWVMVPQNATRSNSTIIHHFSHLPTGRGAVLSLPELTTHSILTDSDGFLLLIDKKTKAIRLYNPFNRYLSEDLPPILKNVKDVTASSSSVNFITLVSPSTSSPGRPTVMLSFGMADGAAFAKPGDNSWSFLKLPFYISGALLLKGQFYFVDLCGSIWAVEPEHKLLTCVIRQDVCTRSWDIVKFGRINILLLEWGLVDKQRSRVSGPLPRLKIFIIDLDYKVLIPLSSIGENAIFVDQNKQTFLVPSKHPLIKGDSIYFWSNRFQSIVYDLERKTIECSGLELANIRREISSLLYYGPINIDLHIFDYRKYRLW